MRHEAIYTTHPTVTSIIGDDTAFDKDGNLVTLNETLVTAEIARLKSEFEAKEYQRLRVSEYPSFADQFDLLYHGGYDAWKSAIQAVKDKYPKE